MSALLIVVGLFALGVLWALVRSVRVVRAQTALVVERLGRYAKTLGAGFHLLVPFLDRVRYRHSLKEQAMDVPSQPCITLDNVKVMVDGVLYYRVVDPRAASYGIKNYQFATVQLAQTTMRSVIGQLELDRTFEERERINAQIVASVDQASDPWGVKVTRYEVQNINVPASVLESMEYQIRAERDKRAVIARSVGEMESRINRSMAEMQEAINKSEGEKQRQINEADGQAEEITALARATAAGLGEVAGAIAAAGGEDAVLLRIAEAYLEQLRKLSSSATEVVLPMDLTNIGAVVDSLRGVLQPGAGPALAMPRPSPPDASQRLA